MVNTLYNLAVQKVATSIAEGHYEDMNETFILDSKASNLIYAAFIKIPTSKKAIRIPELVLNLTNVDLRNTTLCHNTIEMLRTQRTLESLALGRTNIVALLKDILNEKSRKRLRHLNIRGAGLIGCGWSDKLSELFPSLKTLNVSNILFENDELLRLCVSFPSLCVLDISGTNIASLHGLSNLKNLQELSIRYLEFANANNLVDLFQLTNLKVLDMSKSKNLETSKNVLRFVECGMNLPELRVLDCSGTDIDEELFAKLLSFLPNLQQIALMDCQLKHAVFSTEIRVLNSATLETSFQTLNYYSKLKKSDSVMKCFQDIFFLLKEYYTQNKEYDIAGCLAILIRTMEQFVTHVQKTREFLSFNPSYITTYASGILCVTEIVSNNAQRLRPVCAVTALRVLLNFIHNFDHLGSNFTQYLRNSIWSAIQTLVTLDLSIINYDDVCDAAVCCLAEVFDTFDIAVPILQVLVYCFPRKRDKFKVSKEGTIKDSKILIRNLHLCMKFTPYYTPLCQSIIDIIFCPIMDDPQTCLHIVENKGAKDLFNAINKFDNEPLQLEILRILKRLVVCANASFENFIEFNVKYLKKTFNKWKSDRLYLLHSIFSILLNQTRRGFRNYVNRLLRNNYHRLETSEIVDIDLPIFHSLFASTQFDGPILWALFKIEKFLEQHDDGRRIVEKFNILNLIINIKIKSKLVKVAKERILLILK
ncbi:Protein zyg-11 homolog B [Caenorhabditis elegans]|uniref:Protein zyg-11 homolog B n=1 Tax=Caenorhabditis elegans TaxID=6239 RepID=A0A5K1IAT8_CAEEL|nr:Protein zyg-11 homolog B [Caenorhabditis elegans]VWL57892.1 Protein zyg-11 homolog B [Caenorhabditis elegans]